MNKVRSILLPALKAKMGDNVYYISFMNMKEIANRLSFAQDIHTDRNLSALIQREVTNRSAAIATYLKTQPQRFFNSIIIGVYGGSPEWYELSLEHGELFNPDDMPIHARSASGLLKLNGEERLFAIDGQHRLAGIKEALKHPENQQELEDEEICTIFLAADVTKKTGLERTRRLFSTLNRWAKPVDMMEIIALDEDDAIAIITRRLMEDYPLFKGHRISIIKGKALSVNDKKAFTSITTLYEVNDMILATHRGAKWKNYKSFRPSDNDLDIAYKRSTKFWSAMIRYFPMLKTIEESTAEMGVAGNYRHRRGGHLLFRTIGLLAMAKAIKMATDTGRSQTSCIKILARVPLDLAKEPWAGLLWEPISRLMIARKENQNTATFLLLYMMGINLTKIRLSEERLKERYASALNRPIEEVKLPSIIV